MVVMKGGASPNREDGRPPADPGFDRQPVVTTERSGAIPSTVQMRGGANPNWNEPNAAASMPLADGPDPIFQGQAVEGEQPMALNARFASFAATIARGGPTDSSPVPTSPNRAGGGAGTEGGGGTMPMLEPGAE